MSSILKYEGVKFEKGSAMDVADLLTVEQALQITINGKPFTVVMQTPGDEKELAFGLLYAEDVLKADAKPQFEERKNKYDAVEEITVTIPEEELGEGFMSSRSLLSVSSCGICGKLSLEDLEISGDKLTAKEQISIDSIHAFQAIMVENQEKFLQTGGSHAAAAFDQEGNLLAIREDIGRHNAVDKVVGDLILNGNLSKAKALAVSGRMSYEIVSKAFRAKIPIIAAVSAPSSLGIDFAKEYGMTILGFTRDGKATCYSNPWRIMA